MMWLGMPLGVNSLGTCHHSNQSPKDGDLKPVHSLRGPRLRRMRVILAPLRIPTQCREFFIHKVAYPLTLIRLGTSNLHRTHHRFSQHQKRLHSLYRDGLAELDDSQLQDLVMYTGIAIPRNITRWILGLSYLMRELLSNPQQEIWSPRNLHHLVATSTHCLMALALVMSSFLQKKTHSYQPGSQPLFSFIHSFIHCLIDSLFLPREHIS